MKIYTHKVPNKNDIDRLVKALIVKWWYKSYGCKWYGKHRKTLKGSLKLPFFLQIKNKMHDRKKKEVDLMREDIMKREQWHKPWAKHRNSID